MSEHRTEDRRTGFDRVYFDAGEDECGKCGMPKVGGPLVVVVTRHPDAEDDIRVFGGKAEIIYMDEGSSFDRARISPGDWNDEGVIGFIDGHAREVEECPNEEAAAYALDGIVMVLRDIGVEIEEVTDGMRWTAASDHGHRTWNPERGEHDVTPPTVVAEGTAATTLDAVKAFATWAEYVEPDGDRDAAVYWSGVEWVAFDVNDQDAGTVEAARPEESDGGDREPALIAILTKLAADDYKVTRLDCEGPRP